LCVETASFLPGPSSFRAPAPQERLPDVNPSAPANSAISAPRSLTRRARHALASSSNARPAELIPSFTLLRAHCRNPPRPHRGPARPPPRSLQPIGEQHVKPHARKQLTRPEAFCARWRIPIVEPIRKRIYRRRVVGESVWVFLDRVAVPRASPRSLPSSCYVPPARRARTSEILRRAWPSPTASSRRIAVRTPPATQNEPSSQILRFMSQLFERAGQRLRSHSCEPSALILRTRTLTTSRER